MSNSSVSSVASAVSNAAAAYLNKSSGGAQSSTSSALAEASETPAVTAKEAARGDAVAKRLLAKEQAQQAEENPAPAQEPGKGVVVDQHA